MRAGGLNRSRGAGSKIGCVLDIDFRKADVAADQYFMDRSVYGHRCQRKATAHWTLEGWDFDGDSDYVDCGSGSSLDLQNNFAMEARFKSTSAADYQQVIWWGEEAVGKRRSMWVYLTSDHLAFSGYGQNVESSIVVADGAWHCCMINVGSDNGTSLYAEGDLVKTGSPALVAYTYAGTRVGATDTPTEYFNGVISLGRFHNRAEYAARILQRAIRSSSN